MPIHLLSILVSFEKNTVLVFVYGSYLTILNLPAKFSNVYVESFVSFKIRERSRTYKY